MPRVEAHPAGGILTFQTPFGGVALIGRASALHAEGWRFESARLHQRRGFAIAVASMRSVLARERTAALSATFVSDRGRK